MFKIFKRGKHTLRQKSNSIRRQEPETVIGNHDKSFDVRESFSAVYTP